MCWLSTVGTKVVWLSSSVVINLFCFFAGVSVPLRMLTAWLESVPLKDVVDLSSDSFVSLWFLE